MIQISEERNLNYDELKKIKYLYHWTNKENVRNYILKNGITADDEGFVYLSEKPFNETRKDWEGVDGYLFKVRIPDSDRLCFWEEYWTDDEGNEIDFDHHADPNNKWYIYLGNISLQYIEEITK